MPLHLRARAGLGYLPQDPAFFPEMDVAENLALALEAVGSLVAPDSLLARVDLAGFGPRDVRTLSGGERKRLAVARLLALDPRVLVLDEPFAGVDPVAVAGLQDLVRGLAGEGRAVLLTDHAVRETLAVCTRVVLLDRGSVQVAGAPAEVLAHAQARARYFGDTVFLQQGVAGG
jgi:lipopolysaccharide export system ATP-binding protein